jgi:hypothetical protein
VRTLSLGRVFAGMRTTFARRWLTILALSIACGIAPGMANEMAIQSVVSVRVNLAPAAQAKAKPPPAAASDVALHTVYLVSGVVALVIAGRVLAAVLSIMTIGELVGDRRPLGSLLGQVARAAPTLALSALLYVLAVLAGAVLIVPALMMMSAWALIYPIQLTERTTALAAFRRSAELTRGHRWLVLGARLLVMVGWLVARALAYFGVLALISMGLMLDTGPILRLVMAPLLSTVTAVFLGLFFAALYVELRREKEGMMLGTVDDVFA